jgi:hypothetical protein
MSEAICYCRKYIWVIISAVAVTVFCCLVTVYLVYQHQYELRRTALFADRDFRSSPFEINDAVTVCDFEAKERYGTDLVRATYDAHSTRWDEKRKVYLIVMRGDVGDTTDYDEVMIYCYVDPRQQLVTYYKSSYLDPKALFGKKGGFFD